MKMGNLINDILKRLKQPKERIGVEFGDETVRFVHLKKSANKNFILSGNGSFQLSESGLISRVESISMHQKKAALSLEHPTLRIRRMDFAKMPHSDLIEGIKWNFRDHVDCPLEKYKVAYVLIPEFSKPGEMALVAYGVSLDAIEEAKEKASAFGLKLVALEPIASSLFASIRHSKSIVQNDFAVCVNIEDKRSHFVVMNGSTMLFSRPLLNASSIKFCNLLVERHLFKEMEALKIYQNLLTGIKINELDLDFLSKVDIVFKDFMRQLVIEIQRSIDAFSIMFEVEKIRSIYLCGEGAYYKGLVDYIGSSIGVETQILDPFENVEGVGEGSQKSAVYAVACGLSIPF